MMEEQLRGFPLMFHNGLLRLACTNAGQFMFNNVDKYLQIMESLNCYAVPEFQQVEAKKIMKGHRQIPWVFFIPGLLFFRIIRFVATMTFWFLGGNPVTPLSVVHYLQAKRRRLRNIKIQGLRILNRAEYNAEDEPPSRFYIFTKYLEMVFQKLQSLFCMAARQSFRDDAGISVYVQGPEKARRNRRKTDLDLNLHVNQFTTSELLDKYAAEDDKEDPDFFNDIESPYEDSLDSDLDENSTNNISLTSALYGNYELNANNLSPKTAESKNQLEVNAKYPECEQHEQCQQLNQQNGDLEKDKNSVYELHKQSPEKSNLNQSGGSGKSSFLGKHLSKSASELSCRECSIESPTSSPKRTRSAANPTVTGVIQKTHGFFSTLKHRLSRGRSKERGRQSPADDFAETRDSTDYAADNSSEHSSSAVTPQSPRRHRATTIGDSPLVRAEIPTKPEAVLNNAFNPINQGDSQPGSSQINLEFLQCDDMRKRREIALRQHAFFQLRIHLLSGHDLVAMDKNGSSDPYVKFKLGGRLLHKSKTLHRDLNPVWDETFVVPIEDPFQPINIKVFDYDWGLQDDFMGSAILDLITLDLCRAQDVTLKLQDPLRPNRSLGEIKLNVTLWPRTQEDKEQYFQRNPKLADSSKRLKSQIWSSVVTIVLIEGRGLPPDADGNTTEPYVKFRLGNEKYKSKTSWRFRWLEQFDLHLFDEEQTLEVSVWRRNVQLGKCIIELRNMQRESTHSFWQPLDESAGEVYLMLTISGTTASETISDLTSYKEDPREKLTMEKKYSLRNCFQNLRDIGHLTVKIFGATGLAAADLGGKSDPFCVLELVNSRLQTQTEYKTLTPNWNKIFTFNVKDMTSALEVTVFDEDRDHKVEFLGRIVIPLLRIRNGEKRWYALKDKTMFNRAKGSSPQILLEMTVVWNPVRAALRALEPKEEKLVQQEARFKRQLFLRNVSRLKAIIMYVLDCGRWIQSCFEWEYPTRSVFALTFWVVACLFLSISTIPALLLMFLIKNYLVMWLTGSSGNDHADELDLASDDEDDDDKEKEEKKTIKERLQAIQEVSQTVQNTIGFLASLGESVKNTFNYSVPELTWLAALLLFLAMIVLHFVPIRVILLIWGIAKFSRRLVRPHTVPNNEVLDLLSRIPNDEEILMFREFTIHSTPEMARKDPRKKVKAS